MAIENETMTVKELFDLERLTTRAAHHAIQENIAAGFTRLEIAQAIASSPRVNCSLRVALMVVSDACDSGEISTVSVG
jgi:hypothetical protein